ncbi:DNA alkylation repair protein [Microbacterium azadirachtae]|uniref:DNA alkylation repair protein n=1 Tax=Microbacterium azadirachtae TaxID=582680 RepID=UPI0008881794|nr:DNA alkylation repair protein [Microbacterium azadirachtae]SDM09027.1 3-methyladenine DNA glycosylase AlkD [Microbacterium azadirachtae]SEG34139.1 3-methyladenine DNA glycosylase AlkD [Microbacterium azadirachtae]SEG36920.1 3-methyladenine DNA glycosylase AlkD [Microbacterium azadirachtae]
MTSSSALANVIREALRAAADPALAPGQQAYMKSAMPFLGVRVPDARRLATQAARGIDDVDELRDAALDLWRASGYREERYAAQALMALKPLRGRLDLLDVHEEMIRTGAWWDHVDEVAHRLADLLDSHPAELAVELRVWADDEDLWIRRAAIIAQLQRRDRVDHGLLSDVIEANLGDEEFFIRKAIGWALRDHARADPDWVRAFVDAHPSLSPLSRREALKHLG